MRHRFFTMLLVIGIFWCNNLYAQHSREDMLDYIRKYYINPPANEARSLLTWLMDNYNYPKAERNMMSEEEYTKVQRTRIVFVTSPDAYSAGAVLTEDGGVVFVPTKLYALGKIQAAIFASMKLYYDPSDNMLENVTKFMSAMNDVIQGGIKPSSGLLGFLDDCLYLGQSKLQPEIVMNCFLKYMDMPDEPASYEQMYQLLEKDDEFRSEEDKFLSSFFHVFLLHEYGHIVLGHDNHEKTVWDREIEADRFATSAWNRIYDAKYLFPFVAFLMGSAIDKGEFSVLEPTKANAINVCRAYIVSEAMISDMRSEYEAGRYAELDEVAGAGLLLNLASNAISKITERCSAMPD